MISGTLPNLWLKDLDATFSVLTHFTYVYVSPHTPTLA